MKVSLTGDDAGQCLSFLALPETGGVTHVDSERANLSALAALALAPGLSLRLAQAELEVHPQWTSMVCAPADHPPLRGLLAVPLVDRFGQNMGSLKLSGKLAGDFTQRDEYVALELAQLASVAIENGRLFTQIRELNASLEARIADRTAELARQGQLYRTLAEQAPEVVWNTDPQGRATFLNRAWYELVGGEDGDGLGHAWLERVHPDDVEDVRRKWLRSHETLQPYVGIRRILARDGVYHTMSYKAAPVLDESGEVAFWVGIDADITEFKAIESALRISNRDLEAFSYSISHELRAPLGAIGGFSQALALKLEGHADPRVAHYLGRIRAGVVKMEHSIEALLSLAKLVRAPLSYETVDLSAIARETLEGLQMQQPGRRAAAQVQDNLIVQGDARLLRLVMENLLGNAWKFTSRRDAAQIEVGKLADGSAFYVRDNGEGFDMAYVGKLFGAFQRLHTESEFPGTGIGLATVGRIMERHQGRAWGVSQAGRGRLLLLHAAGDRRRRPGWRAQERPSEGPGGPVRSGRRRPRPAGGASLPANHSACRCAMDSPIAKVVWCRSSLRLNSTGSRSAAVCGVAAQASVTSARRSRWCSWSWRMRSCRPRNGLPCEGSTSVSSGSCLNLSIESRKDCSGLDSGSMSWTLTLVDMRGNIMSPLIRTLSESQYRAMCSGAWP